MKTHMFLKSLALGLALVGMVPAFAQSYPTRAVRRVVPFPAGSATDLAARIMAQQLKGSQGQAFVVDNKPGDGGSIEATEVIRATADGYTLLFSSNSAVASNVAIMKNIPYDPLKDFTPIAGIGETMLVLMVKVDHPANILQKFVTHVKQRPGKVTAGYGSSSPQVIIAVLNSLGTLNVLPMPYKGIPLAVIDVLGGTVDFTFVDLDNALAQSKGGKLRALGITALFKHQFC